MKKALLKVLAILAVVGLVVGYKFYNKSKTSAEAKGHALEMLKELPDWKDGEAYYRALLDHAHPTAFDASYSMGGRRRSASFDWDRYLHELYPLMRKKAVADGKPKVSQLLGFHQIKETGEVPADLAPPAPPEGGAPADAGR